jgi:hypothetical protein
MVYINVDIPVSEGFRNAMIQLDPEFEGLGMRLSQLLWEDFSNVRALAADTNTVPSPERGRGSNRVH